MTTQPQWLHITVHRAVSLAGRVSDALTHAPIAQADVALVDQDRRTTTQRDGLFYFLDLPAASYRLRVTVPGQGRRYGVKETEPILVQGGYAENGRVQVTYADVTLSPTRIHGYIRRRTEGQPDGVEPIAGAKVQLLGDPAGVLTNSAGYYQLTHLVARKPQLQISAATYATAVSEPIVLTPGADHRVDITLQPR